MKRERVMRIEHVAMHVNDSGYHGKGSKIESIGGV